MTPARKVLLGLGLWAVLVTLAPPAASSGDDLDRAIALASEQRYGQARAVLDPILARNAGHPLGRLLDGVLRAHEGRVGEAIEVFERLRRDHPDLSEAWNNLAVLHAVEGRFDEARVTLLTALERRPSAIGYANLGDIYSSLARQAHGRARELGPGAGAGPSAAAEASGLGLALAAVPAAAALATLPPSAPTPAALPSGEQVPSALSSGEPAPAAPPSGEQVPAALPPVTPAPTALPPGEPAPAAEPPGACLRTGRFEGREDIARVQEWLESNGAEVVELHRVRHREIEHHQVYLPPLAGRAEASDKVRELRARGVRDVAVIRKGPLANGVSLGVFRVAGNRDRRVAALERLGYHPRSRDHPGFGHRYFLELRAPRDPDRIRAAWAKRFAEHSLESTDCP